MTFDLQPIHGLQPEQNGKNVIVDYTVVWKYPILTSKMVANIIISFCNTVRAGMI